MDEYGKDENRNAPSGATVSEKASPKEAVLGETAVVRLARVLQTMREVGRVIVHASDKRRLVDECVRVLTETEVYHSAAIALLNESGEIEAIAQDQLSEEELAAFSGEAAAAPFCALSAFHGRGAVAIPERRAECGCCLYASRYPNHESYCVPIGYGEAIYGVLMILAPPDLLLAAEERDLLDDVATDIGAGVHRFVLEESRRRVQQRLQHSEARMRSMLDCLKTVIICLSGDGKITEFNPEAERFFGKRRTEVVGRDFFAFVHPTSARTLLAEQCSESYQSGKGRTSYEMVLRDAERHSRQVTWSIAPMAIPAPEFSGLLLAGHDTTARNRAEVALREQEATLASLFLAAPIGIGRIYEGVFSLVNAQFAQMTGYARNDLRGRSLASLLADQDHAGQFMADLEAQVREQSTGALETQLRRPSGEVVDVLLTVCALDPTQVAQGMIITALDLRERKVSEQEAQQAQRQLLQAEKMVSLGILVSGIAHEINNPNHVILSHTSLLGDVIAALAPMMRARYEEEGDFMLGGIEYSSIGERLPTMITSIMNASQRISRIVDELGNYVRARPKAEIDVVDLNRVVESALILLSNLIKKNTKDFDVIYGADLPAFSGNYQRLEQVVINLVQNACEALRADTEKILVKTWYDSDSKTIGLEVQDEGRGIAKEDLPYLTDPFFTTHREAGKAGLGLASSHETVQEHHGQLAFFSEPGKGCRVRMLLPEGGMTG